MSDRRRVVDDEEPEGALYAAGRDRLASGGLVDRTEVITFTFDGATYQGHPGDTLASALIANGVRLVGRSFKYHRPRGVFSAGSEEPNALVELRRGRRREPNTKATMVELYDGLVARSQNRWPSLAWDVLSVNQWASPLLVAGFYYKTFMWPASFWERLYEPAIRRAAGLGRAANKADLDTYEKATAHCDVLVIGGGAAGLAAAEAAAQAGARVILADEGPRLGGTTLDEPSTGGPTAAERARDLEVALLSRPDVRVLRRTTVFGVYDGGTYGAVERVADHVALPRRGEPRQRMWRIVARRAILATGATERGIAFDGNDRPGVMLAGAVRAYVYRYGVRPGRDAVVFTNNGSAAATVTALAAAGTRVRAVVDARTEPGDALARAAAAAGAPLVSAAVIARVVGRTSVRGVDVAVGPDGVRQRFPCDLVAVSGGWNPNLHLTTHLGGRPVWDERVQAFRPGPRLPPGMTVVGAADGVFDHAAGVAAGAAAGRQAAAACGLATPAPTAPADGVADAAEPYRIKAVWRVPHARGKAFVDLQNDVTDTDMEIAAREGFTAAEHAKRYTTLGMATDQGRTSGVVGMGILAEVTGRTIAETGVTVMRPPYTPVAIGALGGHSRGRDYKPERLSPSYAFARERGAAFVETGLWMRPQYFTKPGERDWMETVAREVTAVRTAVGVCDVSTLGKIEIHGADAGAFLDRVYVNTFSTLPVGRARYGVMLREDGMVFDDGTTARLGPERFVMTTTTANAARVMQHLEYCHQWLWPDLDVRMVAVTDQWAQYAVAGPKSRELLARVVDPPHDLSNVAFPHMAAAEVSVGGVPGRLFRLSFSGELGYEIALPARYGDSLMRLLMSEGTNLGVVPYGSETLGVMRIEKGHVAGPELNGTTTADDLGLGGLVSKKKDCIGKVLAQRPGLTAPDRQVLVGLMPSELSQRLRAGAHLVPHGARPTADNDQGYVTSVAFSPTLGHWIGLALLQSGRSRAGELIRAVSPLHGENVLVEVTAPVFYDVQGARVRG
jgi:sarcosine oxidase subunit alpha